MPHRRQRPPDYEVAKDPKRACATCRHFDGTGRCQRFNYPVRPPMTCSVYAPRNGE